MQLAMATTRFFKVPELVDHLTHHFLDHRSIACLMRTSLQLYAFCTPALFFKVYAGYKPKRQNLLASKESIRVLARNAHFVRDLELHLLDMVYYVNCAFAYQDQSSGRALAETAVTGEEGMQKPKTKEQEREQNPMLRRPRWLAPPDPQICAVYPLLPMTRLTRLDFDLGFSTGFSNCPYFLPSCKDPRATLTQTCWLLELNPHLQELQFRNLLMKDQRDIRLLARSIFGLKRLQNARFDFMRWEGNEDVEEGQRKSAVVATRRLALQIFFCCPPSLRTLYLDTMEEDRYWMDKVTEEYRDLQPEQPQSWETSHGDYGDDGDKKENELAVVTPRLRKEAIAHLTSLQLWGSDRDGLSEDQFRSILLHCPNLTNIVIPPVQSISNPQQFAQEIAHTLCPNLTTLKMSYYAGNIASLALIFRILEALPEQQVQKFHCLEQSFMTYGLNSDDIGSMFRRQSCTLRELTLEGCRNLDSKATQVILVECRTLERLEVLQSQLWLGRQKPSHLQQQPRTLCIDLEDAVEFPWGCIKIRDLTLTIAIPDEPFYHLAEGVVPYYDRPSPTILTENEKGQFRTLEAFYRQLGRLTELERLDLKAIYHDPAESRPMSGMLRLNSFPGMLNLRNDETGRPGYLHHLGGLNKLRALFGSVSAMTEETKVTIGMEEVKWMHMHWPELEKAYFFISKDEKLFTQPFQWLLKQRVGEEKPLQLATYC